VKTNTRRVEDDRFAAETTVLMRFLSDDNNTDWMELGACNDADPTIFFPVQRQAVVTGSALPGYADDLDDVEPDYPPDEVKAICGFCPVKDICLSWALKNADIVGIWGGTSTYQREQLHRRRARKSCPGCSSATIILSGRHQLCLSCGVSWSA
jgi:WhiB family transcriptional regulator, redox-sensing transcriptional regulator